MRQGAALFLIALLLTAGCLGATDETTPTSVEDEPEPVVLPVDVHLVRVGVDQGAVNMDALLDELPSQRTPLVEAIVGSVGKIEHLPAETRFTYHVHDAPTAFEEGFFETAMATAQEGRPNTWLAEYDREGPQRICSSCTGMEALDGALGTGPEDILYLDARATERWALENLDLLGVDAGPEDLVFLLVDGENAGAFPTDTYHYWRFDDGAEHSEIPSDGLAPAAEPPVEAFENGHANPFHTPKETITMRAWGGESNLVWLDLTGAPSAYDIRPRIPVEDARDPPLWELDGQPDVAGENVGRNIADFLQLRVARDAIYPTHAYQRFITPIHVFVEPGALENPQTPLGVDLEQWVPEEDIQGSIASVMPWVDVQSPVTFYKLPADDPAMMDAIAKAKAYGNPTTVDSGIIKHYIRENWDQYVPEEGPGEFVIPQFYFFFNGPYTFWGVSSAGGWADADEHAHPWAIIDHFFDLCLRADKVPCTKATLGFQNLTILPVHEAGHEIGLTHTKDTIDLDEDHWSQWKVNWLWDSQFSMMSYRHVFMQFDWWDQRFLATAHAVDLIHQTEALGGQADNVRELLRDGSYIEAVAAGWAALSVAEQQALAPNTDLPEPVEEVTNLRLEVAASSNVVSSHNLGIASLPSTKVFPDVLAMASTTFEVPEDATHVRLHYKDAMPPGVGPYKSSFAVLLGPDGDYRGGLFENYEDEIVLESHWRGTGTHELRVYQTAGVTGVWDVEIGVAR